MDFTPDDIRALMSEGDIPAFVRMAGGLHASARHPAEKLSCPHCRAHPGIKCTTPQGKALTSGVHQARVEAAEPAPARTQRVGAWPLPPPVWPNHNQSRKL